MNSERWQKIKEIFNRAADLSVAERESFIAESAADTQMRLEIEKMLAFADEENDVLERSAFGVLTDEQKNIPAQIGKYKIIREIGRGGMGAVYEAIYETANFKQKAAVKVIKRGMDTDAIVSRFRHEQKILASLEHPNIARFLDGGVTAEDGLPFYAMEFVEGEFIDDYCREKNLSVNERLRLFRQVCSAIQYAHQNLVIHRDLKPKNILVTADGTPKLLDFGIGKILSPDSIEEIGTATQLGMMTPAYASPEQIRGERIGTASDVYSLGVILYELLTGQKPYRINSNSQVEIERAVLESEPVKPSTAWFREGRKGEREKGRRGEGEKKSDFQKLSPAHSLPFSPSQLKGDLDNIILKAMRKEPAERYASVGQFSEDVRRYLEGLPIIARPHTFSYRAAKFVRRNRIGVAAAALIFLSLCIGITVAIWQAHRAEQQRILAENRFAQVRQLANSVVFKYHDAIADLQGSTGVRAMLVKDALQYLDALAAESASDVELQYELARAYLKLADAQGKIYAANIGDTEGALASYRKSIALFEAIVKAQPENIKAKADLIRAYDSFAFLSQRSGGSQHSKQIVEKALKLYEELEALDPGNAERQMQLVELFIRLGDTTADFEGRLQEHLKALPLAEKLAARDPDNVEKLRLLARANQRVGSDYQWRGNDAEEENRAADAKELYRKSLEYQRRMFAAAEKLYRLEPGKPSNRRYMALAYINLADSLSHNGITEEALEIIEKAREIILENLRLDPKNNETKFELSEVLFTFATIYRRGGNEKKYLEYYEKSVGNDEEIYAVDQKNLEVLQRLVTRHRDLAEIYEKYNNAEKIKFHRKKSDDWRAKLVVLTKQ
jgi:eukaryotic-like serine/threonine-protein kinase